jgi:hypothetical protein
VSPRLNTLVVLLAATGHTLDLTPLLGQGVDRSLIQGALQRSPEERIRYATVAARNLNSFLAAARRASPG